MECAPKARYHSSPRRAESPSSPRCFRTGDTPAPPRSCESRTAPVSGLQAASVARGAYELRSFESRECYWNARLKRAVVHAPRPALALGTRPRYGAKRRIVWKILYVSATRGLQYDSARRPIKNIKRPFRGVLYFRRRAESNRRMKVLQTSPLPLGYGAMCVSTFLN